MVGTPRCGVRRTSQRDVPTRWIGFSEDDGKFWRRRRVVFWQRAEDSAFHLSRGAGAERKFAGARAVLIQNCGHGKTWGMCCDVCFGFGLGVVRAAETRFVAKYLCARVSVAGAVECAV